MTSTRRILLAVWLTTMLAPYCNADVLNAGFGSGLSDWTILGVAQTETELSSAGFPPTQGSELAVLETRNDGATGTTRGAGGTGDYASLSGIAGAFGVAAGDFQSLVYSGSGFSALASGSAIHQTFDGSAGETISFDFLFLSNHWALPASGGDLNSAAFVVVNGEVALLYETRATGTTFNPNLFLSGGGAHASGYDYKMDAATAGLTPNPFTAITGSELFSTSTDALGLSPLTTGSSNQLGFVVLHSLDLASSGLLVDNVVVNAAPGGGGPGSVPEPSTLALLSLGSLGLLRRRNRCS